VFDKVRSPLGSVDAAAIVVQRFAVVVRDVLLLEQGATAAVVILAEVAVRRLKFCGLVASSDDASISGVHGDSILGTVVDSLDYI
jgi:hypothetical protein